MRKTESDFRTAIMTAIEESGGKTEKIQEVLTSYLVKMPTANLEAMLVDVNLIRKAYPNDHWGAWAHNEITGIIFDRTLMELAEGLGIEGEIKEMLGL